MKKITRHMISDNPFLIAAPVQGGTEFWELTDLLKDQSIASIHESVKGAERFLLSIASSFMNQKSIHVICKANTRSINLSTKIPKNSKPFPRRTPRPTKSHAETDRP